MSSGGLVHALSYIQMIAKAIGSLIEIKFIKKTYHPILAIPKSNRKIIGDSHLNEYDIINLTSLFTTK